MDCNFGHCDHGRYDNRRFVEPDQVALCRRDDGLRVNYLSALVLAAYRPAF